MPSIFEELWIFSHEGAPLIEIFHSSNIHTELIAPFLSAIESFSKELTGQRLESITMGDHKFVLATCLNENILLVSVCNIKVKDKLIKNMFNIMANYFEEMYTIDDIKNWNGDLSLFDKYKDRIELYLKMSDL